MIGKTSSKAKRRKLTRPEMADAHHFEGDPCWGLFRLDDGKWYRKIRWNAGFDVLTVEEVEVEQLSDPNFDEYQIYDLPRQDILSSHSVTIYPNSKTFQFGDDWYIWLHWNHDRDVYLCLNVRVED